MPRTARIHILSGYYHLMGRGLERQNILSSEADKRDFLCRLGKALDHNDMQSLAWALMTNHFHILVRVEPTRFCKLMSSVLIGYAGLYNRRHRRPGYVFQNRYKSNLCNFENYFLELVR